MYFIVARIFVVFPRIKCSLIGTSNFNVSRKFDINCTFTLFLAGFQTCVSKRDASSIRRITVLYLQIFAEAHVLRTTGKIACSLDQTQSNYSDKLTQLDFRGKKLKSGLAAKHR